MSDVGVMFSTTAPPTDPTLMASQEPQIRHCILYFKITSFHENYSQKQNGAWYLRLKNKLLRFVQSRSLTERNMIVLIKEHSDELFLLF